MLTIYELRQKSLKYVNTVKSTIMQETRIVHFFTSASLVELNAIADELVDSCNDLLLVTPSTHPTANIWIKD